MTDFKSLRTLTSLNRSALEHWASQGFTDDQIREASKSYERCLAARFDFAGEAGLKIVVSTTVQKRQEGHVPAVLKLIERVIRNLDTPITGSLLVMLEDGMWQKNLAALGPVCSFGRDLDDRMTLLIPDAAFLDSNGYEDDLAHLRVLSGRIPWEQRATTAYWRGAGSGCAHYAENWKQSPRVRLALFARDLARLEVLDACITKVVEYGDGWSSGGIPGLGIVGEPVPFENFLNYRYVLDVDGEHCAWKSCFLKLASGSVLFKVKGPWCQWYYDRIEPWKHYIPVSQDLSDLVEHVEWARAHDDECRKIVEAAMEVVRELTFESVSLGVTDLIRDLFRLRRGEP